MSRSKKPITFLASIPPIKSGILIGGLGEMQIKLDVPASQKPNAIGIVAMTETPLEITVTPRPDLFGSPAPSKSDDTFEVITHGEKAS